MHLKHRFALAVFLALAGTAGVAFLSNQGIDELVGTWVVKSTASSGESLARLNVRPGTEIVVSENGYVKIGTLGIDGVVGAADCGRLCYLMTVNMVGQTFEMSTSGRGSKTLALANRTGAQFIVAERK